MISPVRLLPAAETDVVEAVAWYNAENFTLGQDFLEKFDGCLGRIQDWPLTFPIVLKQVRRAILKRFPYCVYFVVRESDIVVIAVLHGRRDPRVWQRRRIL